VLGYWTVASRLLQALVLLFESLWRVAFPAMASAGRDRIDPAPILERGLRIAAVATGAIVVVLAGTAPALVATLFGERWHDSIAILPWAGLGALILGRSRPARPAICPRSSRWAPSCAGRACRQRSCSRPACRCSTASAPSASASAGSPGSVANAAVLGRAVRRHAGINVIATMASPVAGACIAACRICPRNGGGPGRGCAGGVRDRCRGIYLALSSLLCRAELLYIARLGRRVVVPSRRMPRELAA